LRDGASVILTGSTAATTGMPAFSVYGASKAAIRSFARNWIVEIAPRSIRVNVLVPGSTSTEGWHALAASEEEDELMQRLTGEATPLGRLADSTEIAAAALFLASDESSYVNGSELFVDGRAAQI
jgi:NAD(P)-dependent dehydrogenase (short-subunit alcohol dehydrogenase family)